MWIFTPDGFFSVVEPNPNPTYPSRRSPVLLVRARLPGHLERHFPDYQVIETPLGDYRYRAYVPRGNVVAWVKRQVEQLDYANFKNAIPDSEETYHTGCFGAWHAMLRAQGRAHPDGGEPWLFDDPLTQEDGA